MYRILRLAQDVITAQETSGVPTWLSIFEILASLLLTIVTIAVTIKINTRNEKFQKEIYNRDIFNQTRQIILDVYGSYCNVFISLCDAKDNLLYIFSNEQLYNTWAQNFLAVLNESLKKYNQLLLFLNDNDFKEYLKKCNDSFKELNILVWSYINSTVPNQRINDAWNEIMKKYNIPYKDYYSLYYNPNTSIRVLFFDYCSNEFTNNIQRHIEKCVDLLSSDEFDEKFRMYLQIQKL
ncbi:MAG: hypothetical protein HDT25_04475 [Ruminococcus sp.]|nr:hypothetical protein [Ruminococcus sp.]